MTVNNNSQFEKWASQQQGYTRLDLEKYAFDCILGKEGEYRSRETTIAWLAWQAATEYSMKNTCNRN
jgi:hypothetical protein